MTPPEVPLRAVTVACPDCGALLNIPIETSHDPDGTPVLTFDLDAHLVAHAAVCWRADL